MDADERDSHQPLDAADVALHLFTQGKVVLADTYEIQCDDSDAEEFPILVNGVVAGSIVMDERFYRARREVRGHVHLGPERAFAEASAADFIRWFEDPLNNLDWWTEVLTD